MPGIVMMVLNDADAVIYLRKRAGWMVKGTWEKASTLNPPPGIGTIYNPDIWVGHTSYRYVKVISKNKRIPRATQNLTT